MMINKYRTLMVHRKAFHIGDAVIVNRSHLGIIRYIFAGQVIIGKKSIYYSEIWEMEKI